MTQDPDPMPEFDSIESAIDALEDRLDRAADTTDDAVGAMKENLVLMQQMQKNFEALESGLSSGLKRAFDDVVFEGARLSDALRTISLSVIDRTYNAAVGTFTDDLAGVLTKGMESIFMSMTPFEKGGSFTQGRVTPFANGGVVSGPVSFPMRGGMGLMGEAGPEAIMPLARGADGKLGVRSQGGSNAHVVINITTPDVQGFQRSQGQIASQISRAISRGQRNR